MAFSTVPGNARGVMINGDMDYMVYAYLQLAQDKKARAVVDELAKIDFKQKDRFAGPYAVAASQARYVFERGDWKAAAELQPRQTKILYADAVTYFARSVGDAIFIDVIRERKPRFIPAAVIGEYAELLRSYGVREVSGDKFAGGFHTDEWRRNGIVYKPSEKTTSDNYLAALPMLLSGRARLLDHEALRKQLAGLERRVHTNGRESVNHGTEASAHDDVAAAACGALVLASKPKQRIVTGYAMGADGFGRIYWPHLDDAPRRSRVVFRTFNEQGVILKETFHVPE